jgi:putative redox protein
MTRKINVEIGSDRYATQVRIGDHTLLADEPAELGGSDRGPTPIELLLASVASCKAVTARMYADRKEWPLESIEIEAEVASRSGIVVTEIDVRIGLTGDLTEEQRERLLDIAGRCPVEKAIGAGVEVKASLA